MIPSARLEQQLQRWIAAGILDAPSSERIRAFESSREPPGVRWPVILAIAFGSIMIAAGVLLFVAAHWENLSPAQRFLLVLAMIAGFHLAAGARAGGRGPGDPRLGVDRGRGTERNPGRIHTSGIPARHVRAVS